MMRRFLFLLLILTISYPVYAAGIVLSPPKFEFQADPGQEIYDKIKITNNNEKSILLNSEVQDFVASGETGQPAFVNPEENNSGLSLANWIIVNNKELIEIKPGEKKEIPFIIKVPDNAEPGGKYGTIFFHPPSEGGQVAVIQKIGSLILVRVNGEIVEDGNLDKFGLYDPDIKGEELSSASEKTFYEKVPVNFSVRFENTGNVHVKPTGKIEIFNIFGKQVSPVGILSILDGNGVELKKEIINYIPFNNGRGNVLAKSFRKFDVSWDGIPFWYREDNGSKTIKYKTFLVGYYKANLELVGAKGQTFQKSVNFIIFPWKEILGGSLGLIIFLFIIIKYRSWSRKRLAEQIRKQMEKEKKES